MRGTGTGNGRVGDQGGWQTFRGEKWQKSQNVPLTQAHRWETYTGWYVILAHLSWVGKQIVPFWPIVPPGGDGVKIHVAV